MVMVYVPAGNFQVGSTDSQIGASMAECERIVGNQCGDRSWYADELPQHSVTLDSFWIDRTEVSNAQYRQCVDSGICQAPTKCDWGEPTYDDKTKTNYPVVCVSWYDTQAYCAWVGRQLPTEAEWEYAARGPKGNIYPWGNEFNGTRLNFCDRNCTQKWKNVNYGDGYVTTAPVGSYEAGGSWCGALDMAGNVWEWVSDWYSNYPPAMQTNPAGPATGDTKVVRGGSWYDTLTFVRAANRVGELPSNRTGHRGFRCVMLPMVKP
jgi:formylglycine-generating enzyme required for sulfatase activity